MIRMFDRYKRVRWLLVILIVVSLAIVTIDYRSKGNGPFERTVFIDRGSRAGVKKDMPVIAGDGLVGRVIRVGASTSEILLLIDRTSAVASRVVPSGETGLLEGDGSENTKLELFNPDAKLGVGDRVVTSGYDRGLYPPGIPIGTVVSAPPAQSNLSRVVTIQPYVDFSSLDYVLLIIGQTATSSPSPSPSGTVAP